MRCIRLSLAASSYASLLKWSLAQQENGNVAGVRCRAAAKAKQARLPGGDASLSPLSRAFQGLSRGTGAMPPGHRITCPLFSGNSPRKHPPDALAGRLKKKKNVRKKAAPLLGDAAR